MPSFVGHKFDSACASFTKLQELVTSPSFIAAGATATSFVSFASIALPICAITSTITGIQAQCHLQALGQEISEDLKQMATATQTSTTLQYQKEFAQHVHLFAASRIRAAQGALPCSEKSTKHYFFVYHPGTDWHPSFEALLQANPLPSLLGQSHSLEVIEKYIAAQRAVSSISRDAVVHVLMPSAHSYIMNEVIMFNSSDLPVSFEGQLGASGKPFVMVNMPTVRDECLQYIGRVPAKTSQVKRKFNEKNRDLVATAAAVPSGILGGLGGAACCFVALSGLTPAGPLVLIGSALALGATSGTGLAMAASDLVEVIYNGTHEKR